MSECEMCDLRENDPYKYNLIVQIRHNADCEEFHQKQGNSTMQYYHKEERLRLEKELHAYQLKL